MLYRQVVIDYGLGCQHKTIFGMVQLPNFLILNHFAPLQVDLNY